MALGIVPDDVFESEVEKYLNGTIVEKKTSGRRPGDKNIPLTIQKLIGDEGVENGNKGALELASMLDVSKSQVSAYKKGATSLATYNNPAEKLGAHIAKTKARISNRAASVAKRALNNITDEKLEAASATELASIARSASSIVRDMEPAAPVNQNNNATQIIIHAPAIRDESKYSVIEIESSGE